MNKLILFVLIFVSLSSCNRQKNDPTIKSDYIKTTLQYQNVSGISKNLSSLDINYFDTWTNLKPVVIFIHGGGWAIGDKRNKPNDKIKLFESLKYVYVSINYRLSPFPYDTNNPNRIKHPDHIEDIANAVKYIFENVKEYGGDNSKMAIMGHSAGAHLSSLISSNPRFLESVGLNTGILKGTLSLDTQAYNINELMKDTVSNNYKMYLNAFGDKPEDWKDVSPQHFVSNSKVNNWLVVYRGSQSRVENQLDFINSLENNGKNVVKINAESYSHSGVNDAIGIESDQVINTPVKQFFQEIFR
jgi:acetyl esterase/lipase